MRTILDSPSIVSTEIGRNGFPDRETDCPRPFARAARALWPNKTAAELAVIAHATERAAKNWLSGDQDPPATVIAAMLAKITSDFE